MVMLMAVLLALVLTRALRLRQNPKQKCSSRILGFDPQVCLQLIG